MKHKLQFKDLALSKETVYAEMGYGKSLPEEPIQSLVDHLFNLADEKVKPSFYFQISNGILNHDHLICGPCILHVNRTIATLLRNSEQFIFFVATAGLEYQEIHNQLNDSEDILTLFVWDSIGSCIAEATGDFMEKFIEANFPNIPHTNRFSPGYCGWHVMEQKVLFSLLPPKICDIELNESALMYPIKSISGVIGMGAYVDTHKNGCQFCELDTCYKKNLKKRFNHEAQSQQ